MSDYDEHINLYLFRHIYECRVEAKKTEINSDVFQAHTLLLVCLNVKKAVILGAVFFNFSTLRAIFTLRSLLRPTNRQTV